jgi:hypothetical protein
MANRFPARCAVALLFGLSCQPVLAQSDLCLEFASDLCEGEDLGTCFTADEKWAMLPDSCEGDIQRQIEMDREFEESANVESQDPGAGPGWVEVAQYQAEIGAEDLFSSDGVLLKSFADVLRQDRANVHYYGTYQDADEVDGLFEDRALRAEFPRLVANGYVDPQDRDRIMRGGAIILVTVLGKNGRLMAVDVGVLN